MVTVTVHSITAIAKKGGALSGNFLVADQCSQKDFISDSYKEGGELRTKGIFAPMFLNEFVLVIIYDIMLSVVIPSRAFEDGRDA